MYLNFLKKKKSIFNNLTSEFINGPIDKFNHYNNIQTKNIRLDNSKYFEFLSSISTGWTNTDLYKLNTQNEQNFPVYSAKKNPIAFVSESDPKLINCSDKCKLFSFASNGSSSGSNFVIHERPFYVSNDRVVIKVKNDEVLVEWLKYGLRNMRYEYDFAWEEKANIKSIKAKEEKVAIRVDNNKLEDLEKQ
ncbi:MAG: hypothetical protein OXC37_06120, partial [Bdellovibrionaceae bacterium]|nr:hypothetical protein [Pseudobdellovibrionaceae bacterium]